VSIDFFLGGSLTDVPHLGSIAGLGSDVGQWRLKPWLTVTRH
jgi:hypothetical protein